MEDSFKLHTLRECNGKTHTALKIPKRLPDNFGCNNAIPENDVYNLVMVESSNYMEIYWPSIVSNWNTYIKNNLKGRTNIYNFGSHVDLRRCEPDFQHEDIANYQGVNFTQAIRSIRKRVDACSESNICIFIIITGIHDTGEPYPASEICKIQPPEGKHIRVYVLGIGIDCPLEHFIDLRSKFHNGSSNVPIIYQAKDEPDIEVQCFTIGEELKSSIVQLKLNIKGSILPGMQPTDIVHLGEWLYFDQSPENLPVLALSINGSNSIVIKTEIIPHTDCHIIGNIFRQWNTGLIQLKRKSEDLPLEALDLIQSMFEYSKRQSSGSIQATTKRKALKGLKDCEHKFRETLKSVKTLLNDKKQCKKNMTSAILNSTVCPPRYKKRILKLRYHSPKTYDEDRDKFLEIYKMVEAEILALRPPDSGEKCRVSLNSTLCELQDPEFCRKRQQSDKVEWLKTFPMTGIPIYFRVRNWSQINPWTLSIDSIENEPYGILSQEVLEDGFDISSCQANKAVILNAVDEKHRVNAIIPTIPSRATNLLKDIVCSNLYAMMSTFCILKNADILDVNVHLAALGAAWIKTIRDHHMDERPEFINNRIRDIIATAQMYFDRYTVQSYIDMLVKTPSHAVSFKMGDRILSHSLVKPAFFLCVTLNYFPDRFSLTQENLSNIFELLVFEFLKRCLPKYEKQPELSPKGDKARTPFTDFFTDSKTMQEWMTNQYEAAIESLQTNYGDLFRTFYSPDEMISRFKKDALKPISSIDMTSFLKDRIFINMDKVRYLRRLSYCGDITWSSFKPLGREFNISEERVQRILSPEMVTRYVCAALQDNKRNKRYKTLERELPSLEEALDIARTKIVEETEQNFEKTFFRQKELLEKEKSLKDQWIKAYDKVHDNLAIPMSQKNIIMEANAHGIEVSQESFGQRYKYDETTGLLRNACQIQGCPYYLQPRKDFNQHLSAGRKGKENFYPHHFHKISLKCSTQSIDDILEQIVSKNNGQKLSPEYQEYLRKNLRTLVELHNG